MKRRWFQIHLSTAIMLMLTVAVLLWANLSPTVVIGPTFEDRNYGWPQKCFWLGKATSGYISEINTPQEDSLWMWSTFFIDAIVALGILGVVTLIFEVIARRFSSGDQTTRSGM